MKRINRTHIFLILLILSACSPSPTESTSEPDLALTVTAQALLLQGVTQTALAPTSTTELTATTVPSSTPEFTATPNEVLITVSANTNCRSGPTVDYEIVGALTIGQQATVIGKNATTGYWIIENPNGPGTCWLWGEHATITGDTASLQEYDVPPTVTPRAVLAPVIDRVVVRLDSSSGGLVAFLDVYFYDNEGDANYVDLQLISTSVEVTGTLKDISIAPSANQRRGSVVTGQWSCGTKLYDVTVGVTIHDQAGHTSNTTGVTFSCK